jgi:type VI secretion system secreted protein VgrG
MAKLELELCKEKLDVREFSVRERISAPFEVAIVALSPNHNIDLEEIVGRGAGLVVPAELGALGWTGICAHAEQLEIEEADEENENNRSTYFFRIVPSLWLLTQRRSYRIFQHQKTQDIVKKVLGEYRVQVAFELTDPHPVLEYRVQYGETDFDFVSRLLEEAGISYYFERHLTGESSYKFSLNSRLVCSDNPDFNPTMGVIPNRDKLTEAQRKQRFVTNVSLGHRTRPGKYTDIDYNFRNPGAPLNKSSDIKLKAGEQLEAGYEHFEYLLGSSLVDLSGDAASKAGKDTPTADDKSVARHDDKVLEARAQRRAEAMRHGKRWVRFESNEPGIAPGQILSIREHPRAQTGIGPGDKLLVIESEVESALDGWTLKAAAVFADVRYRPQVRTPRARVQGLQTAIVVGPKGKQIYTDEFGRVRVRFHWDREGDFDDKSTCWLRVSQSWAGARFGSMLIPRVGQEVLVDFFEGNPDQPVVVGRLFNATTKVPRELPKHMTQSIWRSATSPQKDGRFHEIMFDDQADKELVFIQSQRDTLKLVKHHETERTGQDWTTIVGEGRVAGVARDDLLQVGRERLVKMVSVKKLNIPEMGEPEVSPGETWIDMVDDRITLTTKSATIVLDGPDIGVRATGKIRFTADGKLIMKGGPKVYLNAASASVKKKDADKQVKDLVAKPDRMIGAIEQLFWQKPAKLALSRKEISVAVTTKKSIRALAQAPGNRPEQVAARKKVAEDFYRAEGYNFVEADADIKDDETRKKYRARGYELKNGAWTRKLTTDEIRSYTKCIDHNQPVHVGPPPAMPSPAEQWQAPGGRQGNFYAIPDTEAGALGIGTEARDPKNPGGTVGKEKKLYIPTADANKNMPPYLQSVAAPAKDTWSADEIQVAPGGGKQWTVYRREQMVEKK